MKKSLKTKWFLFKVRLSFLTIDVVECIVLYPFKKHRVNFGRSRKFSREMYVQVKQTLGVK